MSFKREPWAPPDHQSNSSQYDPHVKAIQVIVSLIFLGAFAVLTVATTVWIVKAMF